MSKILATAYLMGVTLAVGIKKRVTGRDWSDEQGRSLEEVIIAAAVIIIAIGLMAVIANAVLNRSKGIT